jgi:HPt (histidine-containing phosphotransfer) domain-containing protein
MNDFLTKPVRLDTLSEVLTSAIEQIREKSSAPDNYEKGFDFMEEEGESDDFSQEGGNNSARDTKLFDRDTFLGKLDDDIELYNELLDEYLISANSYFADIGEGVKKKDFDQIRIAAHSIKGSSGSIEASQMQSAAANLENAAKQQDLARIRENLEIIEMEYEILSEILKDEIADKA